MAYSMVRYFAFFLDVECSSNVPIWHSACCNNTCSRSGGIETRYDLTQCFCVWNAVSPSYILRRSESSSLLPFVCSEQIIIVPDCHLHFSITVNHGLATGLLIRSEWHLRTRFEARFKNLLISFTLTDSDVESVFGARIGDLNESSAISYSVII